MCYKDVVVYLDAKMQLPHIKTEKDGINPCPAEPPYTLHLQIV